MHNMLKMLLLQDFLGFAGWFEISHSRALSQTSVGKFVRGSVPHRATKERGASRKGTRVPLRDAKMAKLKMAIYYGDLEGVSRKAAMLPWTGKVN
jgi:hypothetical protein